MHDKIITALLAILIALSGWRLTTTVGLKSDVAVLKEKVSGIENEGGLVIDDTGECESCQ